MEPVTFLTNLDEQRITAGLGAPQVDTAEVGQTIIVKAVDENGKPTEWEAADLPNGGEKKTKLITLADITAENNIIIAMDDTDDLSFGDAVIAHRHYFYKTPEGKQLRAKRVYGYIQTPTAMTLGATLCFSVYYTDGDPNIWSFGDFIGNNTGFQSCKPEGNISVAANSCFVFNVSADLTMARGGVTGDISWAKIGNLAQSYRSFDKIFPHISGVKIAISSGSCAFLPAGARFVLKAEVEEDA